MHATGHAYASRFGNSLKPRGDVYAPAIEIGTLDDDIAETYSDAQFDEFRLVDAFIVPGKRQLHIHRAVDCIGGAWEFDQRTIACDLEDAASMPFGDGSEYLTTQGLEPGQCFRLVVFHLPGVADHVGGKDRHQLSVLQDLSWKKIRAGFASRRAG